MGLGELGSAAARALVAHGFQVLGWSRSPKAFDGVVSYAGHSELHPFLHRTDIVVCLLPLTADTVGILDAATFAELPHGACVINVARGQHLVEADLVEALDSGHLGGATLDVFREEPLPPGNPLWDHPKVLVTPHVASYSVPATAADGVRRTSAGFARASRSGTRWTAPEAIDLQPRAAVRTGARDEPSTRGLMPSTWSLAAGTGHATASQPRADAGLRPRGRRVHRRWKACLCWLVREAAALHLAP